VRIHLNYAVEQQMYGYIIVVHPMNFLRNLLSFCRFYSVVILRTYEVFLTNVYLKCSYFKVDYEFLSPYFLISFLFSVSREISVLRLKFNHRSCVFFATFCPGLIFRKVHRAQFLFSVPERDRVHIYYRNAFEDSKKEMNITKVNRRQTNLIYYSSIYFSKCVLSDFAYVTGFDVHLVSMLIL
jgi:hypothetical protein